MLKDNIMRNETMLAQVKQPESTMSPAPIIILVLGILIIVLVLLVAVIYWHRRKKVKKFIYQKIATSNSTRQKPKLNLTLPHQQQSFGQLKSEYENPVEVSGKLGSKDSPFKPYEFMIPPHTPITPGTPGTPAFPMLEDKAKVLFQRSISVPAENVFVSNDRDADGLWRNAVKKASASQFLTTKPKTENKITNCANGKMKFSLKYNILGQKELTVKLLEFIDLPLSRETGISIPFVKVYLYPQTAHLYPLTEKNKSGFRVEVLSFPRENICSFVGCPIDKLCTSALKFVILDYDRFSRSEFVADCVILLDEVSLEGDQITKHLSIRKTFPDRDVGSLLVSLCYQPNGCRMCIIVLKASGLPEGESGNVPDHYVKISLLKNGIILDKRRTRVIKKSVCPVFNERLVFPVDVHGTRSLVFVFDIIRYDSKLKQEKVASVILGNHSSQRQVTPHEIQHFNEMLQSPQRQIAEWHKLVP